MSGLEGTIKTPVGTVQKKTALIVGGGIVAIGFVVWYRQKSLGPTPDALVPEAIINPATGYAYGSAEDAAALTAQGAYQSPAVPTTPGGSSGYPTGTGFVSNGQWSQAVITYMTDNGLLDNPAGMSAALGKYITGQYVAHGSADDSLISQAIAAQGYPPVSGPNGYPPAINRQSSGTSTPVPPKPVGPRGYGWYKAKKGDNITTVTKKYGITSANFIAWNGGDALRIGEWIKVRANSNPLVGYNGIK